MQSVAFFVHVYIVTDMQNKIEEKVGAILRAHRGVERLSQDDLAKLGMTTRDTVSRLERADMGVAASTVERLLRICGARLTVEQIVPGRVR